MMSSIKTGPNAGNVSEYTRLISTDSNRIINSSKSNPNRTYSPPLMNLSARETINQLNNDIDNADNFNPQLQKHYQSVQKISDNQNFDPTDSIDRQNESRRSFNAKRDYFEQRFKSLSSKTDSPPREVRPIKKLMTTITTTTSQTTGEKSKDNNHNKSSTNENISAINNALEKSDESKNLVYINSVTNDAGKSIIAERKQEQYQVILHPRVSENVKSNHDVDDHQAIQKLTNVLNEHNVTTRNVYKRLSSQPSPVLIDTKRIITKTSLPSNVGNDQQNETTIANGFNVIDALLNNPIGTSNDEQNNKLHSRVGDVVTNLQTPQYINIVTSSITNDGTTNKSISKTIKTEIVSTPPIGDRPRESFIESTIITSQEVPLTKTKKSKSKSKERQEPKDYHVIDAVINNPTAMNLPNSYLLKYKINSLIKSKNKNKILAPQQSDDKGKTESINNLVKITNDLMLHYTDRRIRPMIVTPNGVSRPLGTNSDDDDCHQKYRTRPQSEPSKPRVIYRYVDENGRVLQMSPMAPSQLHVLPPNNGRLASPKNCDPTYFHERRIPIDVDTPHQVSISEQKQKIRQTSPIYSKVTYGIPIEFQDENSSGSTSQRALSYHYQNENYKKSIEPTRFRQNDQNHVSNGIVCCETDSSSSERSTAHRSKNYSLLDCIDPQKTLEVSSNQSPKSRVVPKKIQTRNYIEIFRDGNMKPSEIYVLPFDEISVRNNRCSRYDQYQSDKNQQGIKVNKSKYDNSCSDSNNNSIDYDNYLRHSKSFDYRPLRTKLQREYKVTPSLLVDEWDHPEQATFTDYEKKTKLRWQNGKLNKKFEVCKPKSSLSCSKVVQIPCTELNGNSERKTCAAQQDFTDSNRQRPDSKNQLRFNSQPIYRALALHNFDGQTSRELSFEKGDILLVRRRVNDDWVEGEFQGLIGIFPLNHVELFPIDTNEQDEYFYTAEHENPNEGEAIVKYDFIPKKTFELQLRKGDKVILLRRLDDNWYEGRLNHIEGIFPTAYVETLREPPEKVNQYERAHSQELISPESEQNTNSDITLPLRKCQVLYDYKPQNPDELEIHVGDIITIIEMCDDGWYCGVREKPNDKNTMEFGTFPGNYVKLLSE